jgi:1,4-dihydroxy-2-naphthoate polyprenyltransferase
MMDKSKKPGLLKMIRAPFLSSIMAPLFAGILLSYSINGELNATAALLVLLIGFGLHIATNVYNDIYDTIQGTDTVNVHRNESSGGSGVLQDFPELMPRLFFLARSSLVLALAGTVALTFFIEKQLWLLLWGLYLLSAFFSKYYTAPPVKLAYRGWGEVSVWIAFGPMAILIAAVSQNIGFHHQVLLLMPATGLSTLSILLAGQLIDLDADRKGGKHGVASRLGTRSTSYIYLFVQLAIILNVVLLFLSFPGKSWPLLLSLAPYAFVFPKAASIILKYHRNENKLKEGAKLTVLTHLLFSFLLIIGLMLYTVLSG